MTRKAGEIANPDKTGVLRIGKKFTRGGQVVMSVPSTQTTRAFVRDQAGSIGEISSFRVLTIF